MSENKPEKKKRKAAVSKGQTISGRRRADRLKRDRKRNGYAQRRKRRRIYRFRVKVVRHYMKLKEQVSEKEAVERTLANYRPRETWHQPLSVGTIRRWARKARDEGFGALRPKQPGPKPEAPQVEQKVMEIIYVWRKLLSWGGHRIAAELRHRGIAQISGATVYKVLAYLELPVRTYALKAKSDGIAYIRYEKDRPNAQWHMDCKQLRLGDGNRVYICIVIDDHSRYALAAVALYQCTTDRVKGVLQSAIRRAGVPEQIVTDNGREFVSTWEDSLTQFGRLLADHGIEHLTSAPYYPQGNGKAEAFIKILCREVLKDRTFDTLLDLQVALDRFLIFYNNYRLHSALGWRSPVTRYAGVAMHVQGLAGIPGLEPMAKKPAYGPSFCDDPITITPRTALASRALVVSNNC
jgi:transposase InsO family protein